MKKLLIGLTLLTSMSSFASATACENNSYQKTIQDYSGTCNNIILETASSSNCNGDQIETLKNRILAGNMIILISGSSSFCKLKSESGHYQVMTDDMSSPPVATVYFSKSD